MGREAASGRVGDPESAQVVGRHLQALARQLSEAAVAEILGVVPETGIVVAVGQAGTHVARAAEDGAELRSLEALGACVGEAGQAPHGLRYHQVLEVHEEGAQLQLQAPAQQLRLQAQVVAGGGLRLEDLGLAVEPQVHGRRLEGAPQAREDIHPVLAGRPGGPGGPGAARQAGRGAGILALVQGATLKVQGGGLARLLGAGQAQARLHHQARRRLPLAEDVEAREIPLVVHADGGLVGQGGA